MSDTINEDGEIVGSGSLAVMGAQNQSLVATILRAEIDTLVTTARMYPRSIDKAVKMLKSIVTIDAASALECIFALPRGGKPIRGASIRFAEAALASWGNAMVDARVTHVDREEKVVIAEGSYRDLETNVMTRSSVRRRIVDSRGKIYSDDLIIVTGNAACSIARRNAILAGIPKPVWRSAYEAVERTIAGTAETLAVTRDKAVSAFAMFGIKPEQVFVALGVKGIEDVQLDHVITMRGMYAAIKNEEATVEEIFSTRAASAPREGVADPLGTTKAPAQVSSESKPKPEVKNTEVAANGRTTGEQSPLASESPEKSKGVSQDRAAPAKEGEAANNASASPTGEISVEDDSSGLPEEDDVMHGQPDDELPSDTEPPKEEAKLKEAKKPKGPSNLAEYRAHVLAYVAAATNAAALDNDWKSERKLRNDVNITSEVMDELKAAVIAKMKELKAGAEP